MAALKQRFATSRPLSRWIDEMQADVLDHLDYPLSPGVAVADGAHPPDKPVRPRRRPPRGLRPHPHRTRRLPGSRRCVNPAGGSEGIPRSGWRNQGV